MSEWVYRQDAEIPSFAVEWRDGNGALINFASGYTFQVLLVNTSDAVVLTKTTNITGAATSPNVTVAWPAGELNITPGVYFLHLRATSATNDRFFSPGRWPKITIVATPV
jgi:hypothetical protein